MKRIALQAGLILVATLAIAVWAGAVSPPGRVVFGGLAPDGPQIPQSTVPVGESRLLVQIFRGSSVPSEQEISVTTIFSSRSFAVLADADVTGGSEEDLVSQVREIFSLGDVVSLGSTIVPLSGGAALLEEDGHRIELRLEGHRVGERSARIVVWELHDGLEVVATSVIARSGKTVVLAGPASSAPGADGQISFVCLTPLE